MSSMSPRSDSLIGQVLHDTYKILRKIGTGGMSDVYEGEHARLSKKRFAIKVLHPEVLSVPDMYQRFRREAEITTELGHPNIVEVVDFNQVPSGAPYIVMEYLEGEDLGRRIRTGGRLQPLDAVKVLEQVGSALAVAHDHGIVHRDMKPENIFLVQKHKETLVKVLDFGISKIRHSRTIVTRDHTVFGTPHYMSPEQAIGDVHEIDHTTDIFALSVICYQMLSGKLPFDAPSIPEVLKQVCTATPTPVHELVVGLPPGLSTVLLRAMAKKKQERYQKTQAFTADVCICLGGARRSESPPHIKVPPASRVPHPTEFEATQFPKTEPPPEKSQSTDPGGLAMEQTVVIDSSDPAPPSAIPATAAAPPTSDSFAMEPTEIAPGQDQTPPAQPDLDTIISGPPASMEPAAPAPAEAGPTKTLLGLAPTTAEAANAMQARPPASVDPPASAEPPASEAGNAPHEGASGLIEIGAAQELQPSAFEEQPTVMLTPQEASASGEEDTQLHERRTMMLDDRQQGKTEAPADLHEMRTMMLDDSASPPSHTAEVEYVTVPMQSRLRFVIGMIVVVVAIVVALAFLLHDSDPNDQAEAPDPLLLDASPKAKRIRADATARAPAADAAVTAVDARATDALAVADAASPQVNKPAAPKRRPQKRRTGRRKLRFNDL